MLKEQFFNAYLSVLGYLYSTSENKTSPFGASSLPSSFKGL
ncbi:hypothetical protein QWZ13_04495 [Reinekea marina]|nr:hypothetical protein [Reinekea marina]MDN3648164.1 hypothetical protein [Reinekea marina]